jgi:hypothetical protein
MATFLLRQKFKAGFQKYKPLLDVLPKKYEVGAGGWGVWGARAAVCSLLEAVAPAVRRKQSASTAARTSAQQAGVAEAPVRGSMLRPGRGLDAAQPRRAAAAGVDPRRVAQAVRRHAQPPR